MSIHLMYFAILIIRQAFCGPWRYLNMKCIYFCPGLSEVVGALGLEKLAKLMPDIITTAERSDIAAHVRDGYMMMYIYLPMVFGDDFVPYVGPIIPSILQVSSYSIKFFINFITQKIIFLKFRFVITD